MYIVKAGDNLLSIARKEMDCHIKYAELVEVNNWKALLFIPAKCWDIQNETSNRALINNGYHKDRLKIR